MRDEAETCGKVISDIRAHPNISERKNNKVQNNDRQRYELKADHSKWRVVVQGNEHCWPLGSNYFDDLLNVIYLRDKPILTPAIT
jgi:hypothetical protein